MASTIETILQPLTPQDQTFLQPFFPQGPRARDLVISPNDPSYAFTRGRPRTHQELPFVTLTYAQSLDGKIALAPGQRTVISGPETKSLTHYLRKHYDAILIGVGTAVADDPGLNCRYPGNMTVEEQPRPIIIDPYLRWDVSNSKCLRLAREGRGQGPYIVRFPGSKGEGYLEKHTVVLAGGGSILEIPDATAAAAMTATQGPSHGAPGSGGERRFDWLSLFHEMKVSWGIRSVMVEGGAAVISDLLALPELVDSVVVTIAPTWLGRDGVAASPQAKTEGGRLVNVATLTDTAWRQFGSDVVVCGRLPGDVTLSDGATGS